MDTLKVGVIGVGNIGTAHARILAGAVSGSSVAAVYDIDGARAAVLAAEVGARAASSPQELIESVDAIVIASPDDLHTEQAIACLTAQRPALCEKPLAPTLADARAVLDAELALGRRLITMGFMRRFDEGYTQLKGRLDSGVVGEPLLVTCLQRNPSVSAAKTSAHTITGSLVHEIDINRWLLGEEYATAEVLSGRQSPHAGPGMRDPLIVILRTHSNVLVQVQAFMNARYGYDVRCEIVASDGVLSMSNGDFIVTARNGHQGVDVPLHWLGRFGDAYRREMQAWVDAARVGVVTGPTAWDGFVATSVASDCVTALNEGGTVAVRLPDRPELYGLPV